MPNEPILEPFERELRKLAETPAVAEAPIVEVPAVDETVEAPVAPKPKKKAAEAPKAEEKPKATKKK